MGGCEGQCVMHQGVKVGWSMCECVSGCVSEQLEWGICVCVSVNEGGYVYPVVLVCSGKNPAIIFRTLTTLLEEPTS